MTDPSPTLPDIEAGVSVKEFDYVVWGTPFLGVDGYEVGRVESVGEKRLIVRGANGQGREHHVRRDDVVFWGDEHQAKRLWLQLGSRKSQPQEDTGNAGIRHRNGGAK